MKYSRSQIFRLSRDPKILVRFAAGIAIVSVVAAAAISFLTHDQEAIAPGLASEKVVTELRESLESETDEAVEWAMKIRRMGNLADSEFDYTSLPFLPYQLQQVGVAASEEGEEKMPEPRTLEEFEKVIGEDSKLDTDARENLITLARGVLTENEDIRQKAITFLSKAAIQSSPHPYAAEYLGDLLSLTKDWNLAIDAYRIEVERAPQKRHWALDRLIDLLAREGRSEEITRIEGLPHWVEHVTAYDITKQLAEKRDYWGLFVQVVKSEYQIDTPALAILSLLAAIVWALILIRFSDRWEKNLPSTSSLSPSAFSAPHSPSMRSGSKRNCCISPTIIGDLSLISSSTASPGSGLGRRR